MATFDYALSIGPTCTAAVHLRRRFKRYALHGVFDWQVTPADTLMHYLDRDFLGLMELDHLAVEDGSVVNRHFRTAHPHEFVMTDGPLGMLYPTARQRHDFLCSRTRDAFRGRYGRLLLQLSETRPDDELQQIRSAVTAYNPTLRFTVANGPPRTGGEDWRGDPRVWDKLLEPHRVAALTRVRKRVSMWLRSA